jgi:hypothetical protein
MFELRRVVGIDGRTSRVLVCAEGVPVGFAPYKFEDVVDSDFPQEMGIKNEAVMPNSVVLKLEKLPSYSVAFYDASEKFVGNGFRHDGCLITAHHVAERAVYFAKPNESGSGMPHVSLPLSADYYFNQVLDFAVYPVSQRDCASLGLKSAKVLKPIRGPTFIRIAASGPIYNDTTYKCDLYGNWRSEGKITGPLEVNPRFFAHDSTTFLGWSGTAITNLKQEVIGIHLNRDGVKRNIGLPVRIIAPHLDMLKKTPVSDWKSLSIEGKSLEMRGLSFRVESAPKDSAFDPFEDEQRSILYLKDVQKRLKGKRPPIDDDLIEFSADREERERALLFLNDPESFLDALDYYEVLEFIDTGEVTNLTSRYSRDFLSGLRNEAAPGPSVVLPQPVPTQQCFRSGSVKLDRATEPMELSPPAGEISKDISPAETTPAEPVTPPQSTSEPSVAPSPSTSRRRRRRKALKKIGSKVLDSSRNQRKEKSSPLPTPRKGKRSRSLPSTNM